jgi:hypothetical protein
MLGDGRLKRWLIMTSFALMLYAQYRAAWEYADRRSNLFDDSTYTEIISARGDENIVRRMRH